MGKPFINRIGHVYGLLTVTAFNGKQDGKSKATWECLCSCGNSLQVTGSNLTTGHTQSCGCLLISELEGRRIYPKEVSSEYGIWRGIKQRTGPCAGKNTTWYFGIRICPEWVNSFENFLRDMGKRPSKLHSIERKDLNQGYTANNCVWATAQDQANNRSTNHVLTFDGETLTIAQWARRTGIKEQTILARISRSNWTVKAALTTPTKEY